MQFLSKTLRGEGSISGLRIVLSGAVWGLTLGTGMVIR